MSWQVAQCVEQFSMNSMVTGLLPGFPLDTYLGVLE